MPDDLPAKNIRITKFMLIRRMILCGFSEQKIDLGRIQTMRIASESGHVCAYMQMQDGRKYSTARRQREYIFAYRASER